MATASAAVSLLSAALYVALLACPAKLGAFVTDRHFLCAVLALSETALTVRAWRMAGRRHLDPGAFFVPAGIAGLQVVAHLQMAPLPACPAPGLVWSVLTSCLLWQAWAIPLWLVASLVGTVRMLEIVPRRRVAERAWWSRWHLVAVVPGCFIAGAVLAASVWGGMPVSVAAETRVVARYFDAMARRDYRGMLKEVLVVRACGPATNRSSADLLDLPLEDFGGSPELRARFVGARLGELVDEFEQDNPGKTVWIAESRPLWDTGVHWWTDEPVPGIAPGAYVEVAVKIGAPFVGKTQYVIVRAEGLAEPRIVCSSCVPLAPSGGCCPSVHVARRFYYDAKEARRFTRRSRQDSLDPAPPAR